MKNMKKIMTCLCMAVLVLGMTACGSAKPAEETSLLEESYLENVSAFMVSNMTAMEAADMQYYVDMDEEDLQTTLDSSSLPFEAAAFQDAFSAYISSEEELGAYVSTDDYVVSVDGTDTVQITNLTFKDHTAKMTLIYNEDGVVTSISLDINYSMIEILQKAGLNTILGMGTVFAVLIFISLIIALLPKLTAVVEGGRKKKEPEAPKKAPVAVAQAAETEELADDTELVAVISAAIAAYSGTSSDDFVVRSIRRSTTNKWQKA